MSGYWNLRRRLDEAKSTLEEVYLGLLFVPMSAWRVENQALYAKVRDLIARERKQTPEEVQTEFERKVVDVMIAGLPSAVKDRIYAGGVHKKERIKKCPYDAGCGRPTPSDCDDCSDNRRCDDRRKV